MASPSQRPTVPITTRAILVGIVLGASLVLLLAAPAFGAPTVSNPIATPPANVATSTIPAPTPPHHGNSRNDHSDCDAKFSFDCHAGSDAAAKRDMMPTTPPTAVPTATPTTPPTPTKIPPTLTSAPTASPTGTASATVAPTTIPTPTPVPKPTPTTTPAPANTPTLTRHRMQARRPHWRCAGGLDEHHL